MKKDADEKMIMAYLFKHTPLQINFAVNMTCLVPDDEDSEICRPARLDLKQILWHFLHFRLDVVTRRLEHELAALKKRIHLLEGFEKVFDALDEIIRIIRNELEEKRKRARQIAALLKDEDSRWKLVRSELELIQKTYGDAKVDKRRTSIASDTSEPEYSADDFIVE